MLRRHVVGRVRARDFDSTIRRRLETDVAPTVKRRRPDLQTTVKRAIDVQKAFAIEEPTERPLAAAVRDDAGEDEPEYDVDLSDL